MKKNISLLKIDRVTLPSIRTGGHTTVTRRVSQIHKIVITLFHLIYRNENVVKFGNSMENATHFVEVGTVSSINHKRIEYERDERDERTIPS